MSVTVVYKSAKDLKQAEEGYEKQKVKPPVHEVREKYKALGKCHWCQVCGALFDYWETYPTNYCGKCGQKLREDEVNVK